MPSKRFTCGTGMAIISFVWLAASTTQARASTRWTWSYSGAGIDAHGTFVTDSQPQASGAYRIIAVSGTRNGQSISGLQATGTPIPGNEPFAVDNLLFPGPGPQLTSHGWGFAIADGTFSNPFFADFLPQPKYLEFFSDPGSGHTAELPVTFSATQVATPEPATYGLVFGALSMVCVVLPKRRSIP